MMADKQKVSRLLKTARGQIDGILKMIDEDRYCIDISNQILASQSILKKANGEVLKAHLEHYTSTFNPDEAAIPTGIRFMELLARNYFNR